MPESNDFEKVSTDTVVNEVPNAGEVQSANHVGADRFNLGAYAGFFNEQSKGSLNILADSANGGRTILGPPLRCTLDFSLCAWLDPDDESQYQPKRWSRAKSSSAEMPSSRSASSRASRSSASC